MLFSTPKRYQKRQHNAESGIDNSPRLLALEENWILCAVSMPFSILESVADRVLCTYRVMHVTAYHGTRKGLLF